MPRTHRYATTVRWTGNTGTGTSTYRSYARSYEIEASAAKPPIPGRRGSLGDESRLSSASLSPLRSGPVRPTRLEPVSQTIH